MNFPHEVEQLRVIYPEIRHWTGGMIETWWSESSTGMGVHRAEPSRAEAALALALPDHLSPGREAFEDCFDDPFFRFVWDVFRATQISVAPA